MRKIDWDSITNKAAAELTGYASFDAKSNRKAKKQAKTIVEFVKKVFEDNPELSKEEFEKRLNLAMYGSFSVLWLYLFSIAVRMLIAYLIEVLYSDEN